MALPAPDAFPGLNVIPAGIDSEPVDAERQMRFPAERTGSAGDAEDEALFRRFPGIGHFGEGEPSVEFQPIAGGEVIICIPDSPAVERSGERNGQAAAGGNFAFEVLCRDRIGVGVENTDAAGNERGFRSAVFQAQLRRVTDGVQQVHRSVGDEAHFG